MRHAVIAFALLLAACSAGREPDPAGAPILDRDDEKPTLPRASAAERSLLTAPVPATCGTPIVDGVLTPGEWDGAISARFGALVPESAGGGEIPATLQAMSDDTNLYVAIRFDLPTESFTQSFAVELDANGDGLLSHGDDGFGFGRWAEYAWGGGGETYFFDFYRWSCVVDGRDAVCGPQDGDTRNGFPGGGTDDGGFAIGFDADSTTVEMWHPYRSGDVRDVFAAPGDALGINLFVRFLDGCDDHPRCYGDTLYPPFFQYRDIVIGCGTPPEEAILTVRIDVKPGDALPTISLSSGGTTAVAVLGRDDFEVATVDLENTFFAKAPVARREDGSLHASVADVNVDGLPDLVLHFATASLELEPGAIEATIAGTTTDGRKFRGTDVVRVTP